MVKKNGSFPFSYLQSAKRIRSNRQEKLSVARRLIRKAACLAPPTSYLLEKQFICNVTAGDDVGGGVGALAVDDSFWDIVNSLLPSISPSVNKSTETFLLQLLRYASKAVGASSTCQSTLLTLFRTPHLYQPKYISSLVDLLGTAVHALSSSSDLLEQCTDRSHLFEVTSTLLNIILDNLSRLRDMTHSQSFAARIAPILCSHQQLAPHLSTIHPYLFADTSFKSKSKLSSSHPFLSLLEAPNVGSVIPAVLSGWQRNSDYVLNIVSLCIHTLDSQLLVVVNKTNSYLNSADDGVSIPKLSHCLNAITAIFSVVISQNISFTSLSKSADSVKSLFTSLAKLLSSNIANGRVQIENVVSKTTGALLLMLQMMNFNADENVPNLLDGCADLVSSFSDSVVVFKSTSRIINSLINSYSASRKIVWLFKQLAQSPYRKPRYTVLKVILRSDSTLTTIAQSISNLPLSYGSQCISSLVSQDPAKSPDERSTQYHTRDDKECLSFLVSICLESAPKKDVANVIQTISKHVLPLLTSTSKSSEQEQSRASCMFLVASVLMTTLRDKPISAENLFCLLSNGVMDKIFDNIKLPCTTHPKLRVLKNDSRVSGSDIINMFTYYLQDKDIEKENTDGVCFLRLLSYVLRFFLEDVSVFENELLVAQVHGLVDLVFRQSKHLLENCENRYPYEYIDKDEDSILVSKGTVNDTLVIVASLSDVIDSTGVKLKSKVLLPMLHHFICKWSPSNKMDEFFERRFVRDAVGDAILESLKKLKDSLKDNGAEGDSPGIASADGTESSSLNLMRFILEIPRNCLSEEQQNVIVRKVTSISKRLRCDTFRKAAELTSFFFRSIDGSHVLSEWAEDWQSLDTMESRFSMCSEVFSHKVKGKALMRSMCTVIIDHFDEWSEVVMGIVDGETTMNDEIKLRVFKVGLSILKIDVLLQSSSTVFDVAQTWNGLKHQLNKLIDWMAIHAGWYSLYCEQGDRKDDETGMWISQMLTQTADLNEVLNRLETNSENSATLFYHVQLASFCTVVKPWAALSSGEFDIRTSIVRCMLKMGARMAIVHGDSNITKVYNAISLCFQSCQCMLRYDMDVIANTRHISTRSIMEMICLHCTGVLNAILEHCHKHHAEDHHTSRSEATRTNEKKKKAITGLLSHAESTITLMLKSQRAHCMRWSIVNLVCVCMTLAAHLSGKGEDLGQPCGQLVTELITTVEWCYDQGVVTDEIIKHVILTCARCLSHDSVDARFELLLLDAVAGLLQAVPRRESIMNTLIACTSSKMNVVLGNISQNVRRIEYDGQ